jgi:transcriptional regulator with XRE-family HTH domain
MIGQLLKQERTKLNLTQKQLAQKSGISYVSINRIENGKNPRLSVVSKLFEAMGKTLQITSEETITNDTGSLVG